MQHYLQVSKEKQFQPRILYSTKQLINYKSQTKILSDMQSLQVFASHVPFLRKILEGMLLESERVNGERERHGTQETSDPAGGPA